MRNDIILIGMPGCGKGTQADLFKSHYKDIFHLSPGEIIRNEITSKTEFGIKADSIIKGGNLLSDVDIIAMVNNIYNSFLYYKNIPYILYDGFPRTIKQYQFLVSQYRINKQAQFSHLRPIFIYLEVKEETVLERIKCRGIRVGELQDETKNRIEIFKKETFPIIQQAKNDDFEVITIDGELSPNVIFETIQSHI